MAVEARTRIPKERYVSCAFLEREARGLWPRVWLLAVRSAAVAVVGSWAVVEVGRESVIVVRTEEGLRGYHNVCQHRGHRLASAPCGTSKSWVCPYHRWTYGHDGSLLRVPDEEAFGEGFSRSDHDLAPVHVAEALGFVWVHLGAPEEALEAWLGPVLPALEAYRLATWGRTLLTVIDVSANWKTVADAWNETYHAQGIHRQVLELIDDVNTGSVRWGPHGRLVVPFFRPSPRLPPRDDVSAMLAAGLRDVGIDPATFEGGPGEVRLAMQLRLRDDPRYADLGDAQLTDCYNHYVFPNLNFVVWRDSMVLYQYLPHPTEPGRSQLRVHSLQRGAAETEASTHLAEDAAEMEEVLAQDLNAVRQTQRGMASSGFEGLALGAAEAQIRSMHATLDAMLGGDR